MKILLPLYNIHLGSIGCYRVCINLVRELSKSVECVVILPRKNAQEVAAEFSGCENVVFEALDLSETGWSLRRLLFGGLRRISDLFDIKSNKWRGYIKAKLYDIILEHICNEKGITHCLFPFIGYEYPPRISVPLGGVMHDIYWRFDHTANVSPETRKVLDAIAEAWLKKANVLFGISKSAWKELIETFPEYAEKIFAVPVAIDITDDKVDDRPEKEDNISGSADKKKIFLYPAAANARKGHLQLFKAIKVVAEHRGDLQVILTGKGTVSLTGEDILENPKTEKARIFYMRNKEILSDIIKVMGVLTYRDFKNLYSLCSCVILPSEYEGFGLPLAEALLQGVPAICSDIEPFREQIKMYNCEDRVKTFSSGDEKALCKAIEEFFEKPIVKIPPEEIRTRFMKWTWADVAGEYINILRRT